MATGTSAEDTVQPRRASSIIGDAGNRPIGIGMVSTATRERTLMFEAAEKSRVEASFAKVRSFTTGLHLVDHGADFLADDGDPASFDPLAKDSVPSVWLGPPPSHTARLEALATRTTGSPAKNTAGKEAARRDVEVLTEAMGCVAAGRPVPAHIRGHPLVGLEDDELHRWSTPGRWRRPPSMLLGPLVAPSTAAAPVSVTRRSTPTAFSTTLVPLHQDEPFDPSDEPMALPPPVLPTTDEPMTLPPPGGAAGSSESAAKRDVSRRAQMLRPFGRASRDLAIVRTALAAAEAGLPTPRGVRWHPMAHPRSRTEDEETAAVSLEDDDEHDIRGLAVFATSPAFGPHTTTAVAPSMGGYSGSATPTTISLQHPSGSPLGGHTTNTRGSTPRPVFLAGCGIGGSFATSSPRQSPHIGATPVWGERGGTGRLTPLRGASRPGSSAGHHRSGGGGGGGGSRQGSPRHTAASSAKFYNNHNQQQFHAVGIHSPLSPLSPPPGTAVTSPSVRPYDGTVLAPHEAAAIVAEQTALAGGTTLHAAQDRLLARRHRSRAALRTAMDAELEDRRRTATTPGHFQTMVLEHEKGCERRHELARRERALALARFNHTELVARDRIASLWKAAQANTEAEDVRREELERRATTSHHRVQLGQLEGQEDLARCAVLAEEMRARVVAVVMPRSSSMSSSHRA